MLKWNPCRNDNSKTVYGGTKSPVSVTSQSRSRLFLAFVFMTYHKKNRLLTSDIHYLWNGNDFEGVISLKFIHFHNKFDA